MLIFPKKASIIKSTDYTTFGGALMSHVRKTFQDLASEEKLMLITDYLSSITQTDNSETLKERMEWLRRHIPAHDFNGDTNYIFVSYSHRDFKAVYNDLAFFSYNTRKKVRFWYDEGLPAGENWLSEAKKRLSDPNCSGVVFYLSENLLRSSAVLKEIELVKSLNKPYFTITLDDNKFCAADFLTKPEDSELLSKVDAVFPRDDTSVAYGKRTDASFGIDDRIVAYDEQYENAFYRIDKIEQAFSVVEEVVSDFVFEEVEDGLSLVQYNGHETEIYIPSIVERKKVVEIKAAFDNASSIYIPETVTRIIPVEIESLRLEYDEDDINTMSYEAVYDMWFDGIPVPSAPFGMASNLVSIEVDKDNPVYYVKNGMLLDRSQRLVRVTASAVFEEDNALEGISIIGHGAFVGYMNTSAMVVLPDEIIEIEDCGFAISKTHFVMLNNTIRKIGNMAFAHCVLYGFEGDSFFISIPETVEELGEFCFMNCSAELVNIRCKINELPRGSFYSFDGNSIAFDKDSTIEIINMGAFARCQNLENIELPNSVVAIDHYAFTNCNKLFSVTLPKTITYLSPVAFDNFDILKYILYKGNSKTLYYVRMLNDLEDCVFLDKIVHRDQWLKILSAKWQIKRRERIKKRLEKLYNADPVDPDKIGSTSILRRITPPTVFYFLISMALIFLSDYRRLVIERPLDFAYWTLGILSVVFSFMSAKHLYWSNVIKKTKKNVKKNGNKLCTSFFDALHETLFIGLLIYVMTSTSITLLVSKIFGVSPI